MIRALLFGWYFSFCWLHLNVEYVPLALVVSVLAVNFVVAIYLRPLPKKDGKLHALSDVIIGITLPVTIFTAIWALYSVDVTPRIAGVLLFIAISLATKLYSIRLKENKTGFPVTYCVAQTILLFTGVWIAVTYTLYYLPVFIATLTQALRNFHEFPFGSVTFLTGILLLYFYPWLLAWSWARPFYNSVKSPASRARSLICFVALFLGAIVLFSVFAPKSEPPQIPQSFALLSKPPTNDAERNALAENSERIRAGLVDVYLAPQRYLWAQNGNVAFHFEQIGVSPDFSKPAQRVFDVLAFPLFFHGHWEQSFSEQADKFYMDFFGEPIQKGNKHSIQRAAFFNTHERDANGIIKVMSGETIPKADSLMSKVVFDMALGISNFTKGCANHVKNVKQYGLECITSCFSFLEKALFEYPFRFVDVTKEVVKNSCLEISRFFYRTFVTMPSSALRVCCEFFTWVFSGFYRVFIEFPTSVVKACCNFLHFMFVEFPTSVVTACCDLLHLVFVEFPSSAAHACYSAIMSAPQKCSELGARVASCGYAAITSVPQKCAEFGKWVSACYCSAFVALSETGESVASGCYSALSKTGEALASGCCAALDSLSQIGQSVASCCYSALASAPQKCVEFAGWVTSCYSSAFESLCAVPRKCVEFANWVASVPRKCGEFGNRIFDCCSRSVAAFSRKCGDIGHGFYSGLVWVHDRFCGFCSLVVELPSNIFRFVMNVPANVHHICASAIAASQRGFSDFCEFTMDFVNDCCHIVSKCLGAMRDGVLSVPNFAKKQCENVGTRAGSLYSSFGAFCTSSTKSLILVPLNRLYNFQYRMNTYFFVPKGQVATFSSSGARVVRVLRQELTIEESDGMATITITENFENSGYEFSYYFTLPKGAVVTNINLRSKDMVYNASIIPRGSAQQVYLERRKSPVTNTLLEEVGPSQYRMRIRQPGDEPQYSFSYVTFPENGKWIFPVLTERRNIYWDMETVRVINGTESSYFLWRLDNDWMSASLPASPSTPLPSSSDLPTPPSDLPTPPSNLKEDPLLPSSDPTVVPLSPTFAESAENQPSAKILADADPFSPTAPTTLAPLSSSIYPPSPEPTPTTLSSSIYPDPSPNPTPTSLSPFSDEFDPDKEVPMGEEGPKMRYETRFFNPNTSECFSVVALREEKDDRNLTSRNIAIVIDTSLRMKESKERLKKELQSLIAMAKSENKNENISMHVYLVGNEFFFGETKSQDLQSADVDSLLSVFIGAVDMRQILYQFQQKKKNTFYKNVLVLTNQGNEYDQKDQKVFAWNNDEALSVVYLGNSDVTIYSDEVADIIESSRGSIVKTALQALAPGDANVASHDFGFIWSVSNSPCDSHLFSRAHPYFRKLAARQLMHYLARDNTTLPFRHSLATALRVASSYSSFLITDIYGEKELQKMAKEFEKQFKRRLENDRDEKPLGESPQNSRHEWTKSLPPQTASPKHLRDQHFSAQAPSIREDGIESKIQAPDPGDIQAPDTAYLTDTFFEHRPRGSSASLHVPLFGLVLFCLLCSMFCTILL